jgi:hypothetical protein
VAHKVQIRGHVRHSQGEHELLPSLAVLPVRALLRRPASGRARTVASCGCSANRLPPVGGYAALSTLASALGRAPHLEGAGDELLKKHGKVYEAKVYAAQRAGCCLGGNVWRAPADGSVRRCRAGVVRCVRSFGAAACAEAPR